MAETAQNRSAAAEEAERKPTERVILQRTLALVVPEKATDEQVRAAVEALGGRPRPRSGVSGVVEAWVEVSRVTAVSKTAAIEAHAGKPGTPDAKLGVFRAPSVTSWKGAVAHEAPPAPLVQRTLID